MCGSEFNSNTHASIFANKFKYFFLKKNMEVFWEFYWDLKENSNRDSTLKN
jgi:hypothetical protein